MVDTPYTAGATPKLITKGIVVNTELTRYFDQAEYKNVWYVDLKKPTRFFRTSLPNKNKKQNKNTNQKRHVCSDRLNWQNKMSPDRQ